MSEERKARTNSAIEKCPSPNARAVARILNEQNERLGQFLSENSTYGAIFAVGANKPGEKSKRWMVVLATNDAATHLKDWAAEQAKMRLEAARTSGTGSEATIITGDGEPDLIMRVEPKEKKP